VAAFITAIVSTFYFAFGGMKGVAWVTMLHSALKYAGLLIILGFALSKTGGFSPMMRRCRIITGHGMATLALAPSSPGLSAPSAPSSAPSLLFRRSAPPKTFGQQTLHLDRLLFLPAYRLCHRHYRRRGEIPASEINSLYALPVFLQDMNPWLAGLVTTSLVASIFVSVSTVALAIASLVVKDFYVPWRNPTPDQEFRATRWASLIIGFLPLIFVLLVPEVLKLSFFTRAIRLSITVVAVIAFYAPSSEALGARMPA
jgi:SSS family solute:Na+ symporter